MKKNGFAYLLGFSALVLAGIAAFFSVTGLAKLFSGAFWAVVVMTSGLELAKLVATSFLYRYWSNIGKAFRAYMTIGVIVLMMITSAGIYGFLSSAYSVTSDKLGKVDGQVELLEKKKDNIKSEADRIKSIMDNKSNRANALTALRTSQESRIDTLYKKGLVTSARKTEQIIKDANSDIEKTNRQIDSLSTKMQAVLDSAGRIDMKVLELKSSDIKGEVGPLKYIAALTGKDMGSIVNFFILLLIFVCDPLAVCLIIATNKVMMESNIKEEIKISEKNINESLEINVNKIPVNDLESKEVITQEEQVVKKSIKYIEGEAGEFKKTEEKTIEPIVEEYKRYDLVTIPKEVALEAKEEIKEEEIKESVVEKVNNVKSNSDEMTDSKKTKYIEFLEVLYKDGQIVKEDLIPEYKVFCTSLQVKKVEFDENEIKDFLTLCIMLKIITIDEEKARGKALKTYEQAQAIIKML